MKSIKVEKVAEMIVKITIDGELYCYTGSVCEAEKIAKNLNFIFNT